MVLFAFSAETVPSFLYSGLRCDEITFLGEPKLALIAGC